MSCSHDILEPMISSDNSTKSNPIDMHITSIKDNKGVCYKIANTIKCCLVFFDRHIFLFCIAITLATIIISPLYFQYNLLFRIDPKLFLQPHEFPALMISYYSRLAWICIPTSIIYSIILKRTDNLLKKFIIFVFVNTIILFLMYGITHRYKDLNDNSVFYNCNHTLNYMELREKITDSSKDISSRKRALLLCILLSSKDNSQILKDLEVVKESLCKSVDPTDLCITVSYVIENRIRISNAKSFNMFQSNLISNSNGEARYQNTCFMYSIYENYIKTSNVTGGLSGTIQEQTKDNGDTHH